MKKYLLSILSGIIFCLIFFLNYSLIPDHYYKNRDDAVITLSHAKNFVDFGYIGVSPSGGVTEGFSSHLQFWLYVIVYWTYSIDWETFFKIQTWITTFLLGVILFHFFKYQKTKTSIFIVIIFSLYASSFYRFLEWHGSGMENAWMHVLFLYLFFLMTDSVKKQKVNYVIVPIGFLAIIIRTESIYHILPLLLFYSIFHFQLNKDKKVFQIVIGILLLWLVYNIWRIFYFGNFIPNTGLAQNISPLNNIIRVFSLDETYIKEYIKYSFGIFYFHGIYLLLIVFLFLFIIRLIKKPFPNKFNLTSDIKFILFATVVLSITSFFYPIIFGIARMDFTRTTTFIVLFILLSIFYLYTYIIGQSFYSIKHKFIISAILISMLIFDFSFSGRKPKSIGWEIEWYKDIISSAEKISDDNLLYRINLANPDLGKVSYVKKFNIFDLGMLGSPLIASVAADKELYRYYFYNFALPDFIAIHEFWSGYYKFMFFDGQFYNLYKPITEKRTEFLNEKFPDDPQIMEGYYIRKDLLKENKSSEWLFIQELKKNISVERIKQELDKSLNDTDPTAHQYVVRTVFRFIPELKKLNLYNDVIELFDKSPSSLYDRAILRSSEYGNWYKDAKEFLLKSFYRNENFSTCLGNPN